MDTPVLSRVSPLVRSNSSRRPRHIASLAVIQGHLKSPQKPSNSYSSPKASNSYSSAEASTSYSCPKASNSYSPRKPSNSHSPLVEVCINQITPVRSNRDRPGMAAVGLSTGLPLKGGSSDGTHAQGIGTGHNPTAANGGSSVDQPSSLVSDAPGPSNPDPASNSGPSDPGPSNPGPSNPGPSTNPGLSSPGQPKSGVSHTQGTPLPLDGVVAYVEIRSGYENRSEAFYKPLQHLGAKVSKTFTTVVTHVIFRNGKKATLSKALDRETVFLVNPLWVERCKQDWTKAAESAYCVCTKDEKESILRKLNRKCKSMQSKTFEEEIKISDLRERRKRRRKSHHKSEFHDYSKECDEEPSYMPALVIPPTPPSMQKKLDLLEKKWAGTPPVNGRLFSDDTDDSDTDHPASSSPVIVLSPEADRAPKKRKLLNTSDAFQSLLSATSLCTAPTTPKSAQALLDAANLFKTPEPPSLKAPITSRIPNTLLSQAASLRTNFGKSTHQGVAVVTDTGEEVGPSRAVAVDSNSECSSATNDGELALKPKCLSATSDLSQASSLSTVYTWSPLKKVTFSAHSVEPVSQRAGDAGSSSVSTVSDVAESNSLSMDTSSTLTILSSATESIDTPKSSLVSDKPDPSGAPSGPYSLLKSVLEGTCNGKGVTNASTLPVAATEGQNTKVSSEGQNTKLSSEGQNTKLSSEDACQTNSQETGGSSQLTLYSTAASLGSTDAEAAAIFSKLPPKKKVKRAQSKKSRSRKPKTSAVSSTSIPSTTSSTPVPSTSVSATSQSTPTSVLGELLGTLKRRCSLDNFTPNSKQTLSFDPDNDQDSSQHQLTESAQGAGADRQIVKGRPSDNTIPTAGEIISKSTCKRRKSEVKSNIVTTSLSKEDKSLVTRIVNQLKGFRVDQMVNPLTTHLVCGSSKRTLNMLYGRAQGCHLMTLDWVLSSLENGKWLPEPDYYVVPGAGPTKLVLPPTMVVYVCQMVSPPKQDLELLVRLCSGEVARTIRKATVIIGQGVRKGRGPCVREDWLLVF